MNHSHRVRRFGMAVVLCALVARLWAAGVPELFLSWLNQPNITAFLIYLETGRDVRFSASEEAFGGHFRESPAPMAQEPEKPLFSDASETALTYACSLRPDLDALITRPLAWSLTGEEPTVLILHTHTTESYTQMGAQYVESSSYRTLDESYNMLSIGDRVARLLEEGGVTVLHDREVHDYPSYNGSYLHARKSIAQYLQEYPSIRLVLDLHRDAGSGSGGQLRTLAQVEGQDSAQLMLVMGTNASGQSHEDWEENLALALKLHAQLERQSPGIMRPLSLRAQRFNQDLSSGALLVEIGAAGNTHDEALKAAEQLAKGILALAEGTG